VSSRSDNQSPTTFTAVATTMIASPGTTEAAGLS